MGATIIQARPGPIPWSKMHEWCDRAGCHQIDRDFIIPLVMALDREMITQWHAQQRRGMTASPDHMASKLARWEVDDGDEV